MSPVRRALSAVGIVWRSLVAIDDSKFKAVNNRDRNFTSAKLKRRMEEIESSINRYLTALDEADQQEPSTAQSKATHLQEKIDKLKAQMKELQVIEIHRLCTQADDLWSQG